MFCTKCGKDNGDNNKFCIECGAPLVKPSPQQLKQEEVFMTEKQEQITKESHFPQGSDKGTTILGDMTKLKLIIQNGEEYSIEKFPVIIGKGSAADIIISGDESISRQHFCIHEYGDDSYVIEDLDSTNKTYLNGNVIDDEELVVLNDGDHIKAGETIFNVIYAERL